MHRILTALTMICATPAFAGGVATPAEPPVMISPPIETTWTGFYAGATMLFGHGSPTGQLDIEGQHYGIVFGYRQDLGNVVIGMEVEVTGGDIDATGTAARELNTLFNGGFEIGYDAGAFLPYATFGMSTAFMSEPVILPNFDASGLGYFYGIGVDYAFRDDLTIGAELLQHRFTDFPLPNTDLNLNTLSLSATYRF